MGSGWERLERDPELQEPQPELHEQELAPPWEASLQTA